MKQRILIIEDKEAIREILCNYLEDAGYYVRMAEDGLQGFTMFEDKEYDLVILDIMLPKIDGYVVLEMIRQKSSVPVIMLTAMGGEEDEIKGFNLQADDYITKPFSINVVLKRIEVALRRKIKQEVDSNNLLFYKEIVMDLYRCEVTILGEIINLTYKEFELLRFFLENPNCVFTREQLIERVWGYDYLGNNKVINVHVNNLRNKLAGDYIKTVRGMGYRIGT